MSVEQYGEILVKVAFRGIKMPDNFKGFDIQATIKRKPAKIEVKSKVANIPNSPATVLHCNDNKFDSNDGMIHLVFILINHKANRKKSESSVEQALLLSKERAERFRRTKTKSKYISVRQLRKEAAIKSAGIQDITEKLRKTAQLFI